MNVDMMDAEASSTAEAEIARKNGIKERMLAYQKEYQVVSTARRRAQFDVDWEHHERLKRNNWNPKCLRDMEEERHTDPNEPESGSFHKAHDHAVSEVNGPDEDAKSATDSVMSPADATPPPDYQLQDHNEQDWETSVLAARLQDVTIGTATSHDAVSDNYQPAINPEGKLWVRPKNKAEADANRDSRARLRAELRDVRPLPEAEADSNRDARAKARAGSRWDAVEYKCISKKKKKKNKKYQGLLSAHQLQYAGQMSKFEEHLGELSNADILALDYGNDEA